jgi:hypothetical protein
MQNNFMSEGKDMKDDLPINISRNHSFFPTTDEPLKA